MRDASELPPHASERRLIVGAGTEETLWGDARLDRLPACDIDEWVSRFRCIWVVAPHPDDEVLALGGSIAMLSAKGADVRIVSVTDGEASHDRSSRWNRAALASARAGELRDGLAALGARTPVDRLGLPDGGVAAHRQELLRLLVERVERDDLILVTCRFDGHPDHEACGDVAQFAANLSCAQLLEYPVWMWHWATPAETTIPWASARRIEIPDDMLVRKRDAIGRFTSQIERDEEREAILPPKVLERFVRPFEVVFETAGSAA